ncbi:hypothetical protein SHKM778_59110 [Streptomyces sp. KM77-8]|uniref:Uncharacterized protein n=1 Tax=Streptomyces haneummycinicus TaxID=3074435 RepID=A0AAT9HQ81_9ACTN
MVLRQSLALRQGGEEGGRLRVRAVRQVEEGAAVRREHPTLFQGQRGQDGAVRLAAGDQGDQRVGARVGGEFLVVASSRSWAVRVIASSVASVTHQPSPRAARR